MVIRFDRFLIRLHSSKCELRVINPKYDVSMWTIEFEKQACELWYSNQLHVLKLYSCDLNRQSPIDIPVACWYKMTESERSTGTITYKFHQFNTPHFQAECNYEKHCYTYSVSGFSNTLNSSFNDKQLTVFSSIRPLRMSNHNSRSNLFYLDTEEIDSYGLVQRWFPYFISATFV